MTDVSFNRSDGTTKRSIAIDAGVLHQRADFRSIAYGSRSSVRFDIADSVGRNACVAIRSGQRFGLALHPRSHGSLTSPIVVQTYTANHRQDAIVVSQSILKPFEDNYARTLSQDKSVGLLIERSAYITL